MPKIYNFIYTPVKGKGYKPFSDAPPSIVNVLSKIITGIEGASKKTDNPLYRVIEAKALLELDPNLFIMVLTKYSSQKDEFGRSGLEYNHALIIGECSEPLKFLLKKQSAKIFKSRYGRNVDRKIESLLEYARIDDTANKAAAAFKNLFIGNEILILPTQSDFIVQPSQTPNPSATQKQPRIPPISISGTSISLFCCVMLGIALLRISSNSDKFKNRIDQSTEYQSSQIVLLKSEISKLENDLSQMRQKANETAMANFMQIEALKLEIDKLKSQSSLVVSRPITSPATAPIPGESRKSSDVNLINIKVVPSVTILPTQMHLKKPSAGSQEAAQQPYEPTAP